MIVSDNIKIKNTDNLSVEYIETELKKQNITPIRWAITNTDSENLTISLAYERK